MIKKRGRPVGSFKKNAMTKVEIRKRHYEKYNLRNLKQITVVINKDLALTAKKHNFKLNEIVSKALKKEIKKVVDN